MADRRHELQAATVTIHPPGHEGAHHHGEHESMIYAVVAGGATELRREARVHP
jgi:uncharacterized RmlC-like cupin family protein